MPYEIAGNAAGLDPNRLLNVNQNRSDHHHHHNGNKSSGCDIKHCLAFFMVGGAVCLGLGLWKLSAALHDSRGDLLGDWNTAMNVWDGPTGLETFQNLKYVTTSNGGSATLSGQKGAYTPSDFGETTWSDNKHTTSSPQIAYSYTGNVACTGVNNACSIAIKATNNATITRNLTHGAAQQQQQKMSLQATGCQWYDSDYNHPMATIGMGTCSQSINGPKWGPACVDDRYLDSNGCPNDQLVTSYWTSPIYKQIANQPRFTFENGKCWDYTDCVCSGCGYTFKTDSTKGYGFTGYGYYYGGVWYRFTKAFAQMSATEKAQQCKIVMDRAGMSCPATQVNLICFNAGSYPKTPCKKYCQQQDASAVYQPAGSKLVMADFYGPFGIHGKYPSFQYVEGTCNWTATRTERLTKITYAVNSDGSSPTGGRYVSGGQYATDTIIKDNKPLNPTGQFPVTVEIVSRAGPVYQGARITKGCNMQTRPSGCFGATQAENLRNGIVLTGVGAVMLCTPILACLFCLAGIKALWDRKN